MCVRSVPQSRHFTSSRHLSNFALKVEASMIKILSLKQSCKLKTRSVLVGSQRFLICQCSPPSFSTVLNIRITLLSSPICIIRSSNHTVSAIQTKIPLYITATFQLPFSHLIRSLSGASLASKECHRLIRCSAGMSLRSRCLVARDKLAWP